MLAPGKRADALPMSPRAPKASWCPIWRARWRRGQAAGGEPRGGLPRRHAHGSSSAARCNSLLPIWRCCSFRPGTASPTTGSRPMAASSRSVLTTLARLSRLKGSEKPLIVLTTVNAILQRVVPRVEMAAQALSVARGPRGADGLHRRLARTQWLQPFFHGARIRRIRGTRRHSGPVSGRARPAGPSRFLRRYAGIDPHLRRRDPAHAARHARARPGAGVGIPAGDRDHPSFPHGLCGRVRRARARRSALRGGQRGPPSSRHGTLVAAVP